MASKEEAQAAIFGAVTEVVKASSSLVAASRSQVLKNAATAYRLAAGGPQPGGVNSDS